MAKRKHKKRRPLSVARIGQWATPERRRQLGGVSTEIVDRDASGRAVIKRHRARIECALDYYFRRSSITQPQYQAGQKFREIYLCVNYGYNSNLPSNPFLMESGRSNVEGRMMVRIDSLRLLDEVIAKLSPGQFNVVRDVCGYDEYAGSSVRKKSLIRALDILAEHWNCRL